MLVVTAVFIVIIVFVAMLGASLAFIVSIATILMIVTLHADIMFTSAVGLIVVTMICAILTVIPGNIANIVSVLLIGHVIVASMLIIVTIVIIGIIVIIVFIACARVL